MRKNDTVTRSKHRLFRIITAQRPPGEISPVGVFVSLSALCGVLYPVVELRFLRVVPAVRRAHEVAGDAADALEAYVFAAALLLCLFVHLYFPSPFSKNNILHFASKRKGTTELITRKAPKDSIITSRRRYRGHAAASHPLCARAHALRTLYHAKPLASLACFVVAACGGVHGIIETTRKNGRCEG